MPSLFDTRRTFLKLSAVAAVAVARRSVPWRAGQRNKYVRAATPEVPPRAADPDLKALALRALDAATSAGATYADVRFTTTRYRTFWDNDPPIDRHVNAIGVRALTRGAWGFAANTEWSPDVVTQLGTKAAQQAQLGAWSRVPPVQLAPRPVPTGHWEMPVKRDPFTVPLAETAALIEELRQSPGKQGRIGLAFTFQRQDRTFASSDGGYATQVVHTAFGAVPHEDVPASWLNVGVTDPTTGATATYAVPVITPTGAGYEALEDAKLLEHLPQWIEQARAMLPAKDLQELGQYQLVFDATAMAAIVNATFGAALEYDRAVGYEANAGGTSYFAPPRKLLGTPCAPSAVTISADRTLPGGVATVRWDDDGVTPIAAPLIEGGVLVDYATSREFVDGLAPWYQRRGISPRSNGCAASESAFTVPMVHTPNLVLHPGSKDTTVEDLIASVDNGFVVYGGDVQMDFQRVGGRGIGAQVFRVKHGKVVAPVKKAVYTFRSQELWKKLITLGGARTTTTRGIGAAKGQPDQYTVHSVQAVAACFDQVQMNNAENA